MRVGKKGYYSLTEKAPFLLTPFWLDKNNNPILPSDFFFCV